MRPLENYLTIMGMVLFMLVFGFVNATKAQPQPNVYDNGNRWIVNAYLDCDSRHTFQASQGLCFLPYKRCGSCSSMTGFWYSDTFPDWRGGYMQEGDRLKIHGNWHWANKPFAGSDGAFLDLFAGTSPRDEAAGEWIEWLNSGVYGTPELYVNVRLTRVGKCEMPRGVDPSKLSEAELEKLSIELSGRVKPRIRRDGKVAEYPIDPEQKPLPNEREYDR
jgi:hypothetical protein